MAVDFPNSPFVGDVWQNPVTNVYYEWNGEDWRVKCLDRELECEPTGTWANRGEVSNNSTPTSGVYWRIIDESNANGTDGSNSTKLMPAVNREISLLLQTRRISSSLTTLPLSLPNGIRTKASNTQFICTAIKANF